jgi:peptide/nickel transport system permease protein
MALYLLKRLLLMVPTFFAISLVIFVVLNFAPGDPGATALSAGEQGGGQRAELSGQKRESYRLFKEQFNLDKPILWNTRYRLRPEEVRHTLQTILDKGAPAKDRIRAQEDIENWGQYAVPALLRILQSDADRSVRAFASVRLATNTQRPLPRVGDQPLTDTQREEIRTIAAENEEVRAWIFRADADEAREASVRQAWEQWWTRSAHRWDWDWGDRVRIFFFDTRFARYWCNLARLDFGVSHVDKRPVLQKVMKKLKYSITLSFTSVVLVYLISVPLGVWSAVRQRTLMDRVVTVILFMLYSLPSFFVGVFLLNLLTRGTPFQAFPTSGFESLETGDMTTLEYLRDVLWHVALPLICMSYASLAVLSRYARTGLLDVIRADYIRTARAKGLAEPVVIIKHAARNGMIPILTLLATLLPTLIGGSVVVEVIFGIPGMGLFMFQSITLRDYNAVMAVLLLSSALTLVGMLLSDLSYALVDPRISFD